MSAVSRLRVAIVAPSLDILGGQAVQADRLLRSWQNDPDVEAWLVPVNPVPPRGLRWSTRVKFCRTIVTEFVYGPQLVRQLSRADVVHVFSASYSSFLLAPLPAIVVARALGRPVVLNYRSGQALDHLSGSAIARSALASVAMNVVPSRFLRDVFARFGIDATVIANIVDLGRFVFREREPLRPRIVSTRNFESLYNIACTIHAFRIVQDRWPDATLTLVGGGHEEQSLKALVAKLGLRQVVFAGRVTPDEIARHYGANDIYVQTPDVDNMPTSIIEAFASGLPVVSTNVGGVSAILTDKVHGLLSPVNDHEALAAHILQLIDDPLMAKRLTHTAYATCQGCTWAAVRELWLQVYRRVLPASFGRLSIAGTEHDAG